MHHRAPRGLQLFAILLVLFLGVAALVPLTARGAAQIVGIVSTCGGPLPFVDSATVTLVDVNGIVPPVTTTTDGGGSYVFNQPPTASYTISVNRSGWYSGSTTTPVRFDGTTTKSIDLCLTEYVSPPNPKVLAVTVMSGGSPIRGATVAAYQPTNPTGRIQLVTQGTTGTTGVVNLTLWPAVFTLRSSAPGFATVESSVDVSATSSVTVTLAGTSVLFGHVRDPDLVPISVGVVAWLYNPAAANTSISRLIPATVGGSLYQFETARTPNGAYTLIVDANGYRSSSQSVTVTGTPTLLDVTLQPATKEQYTTTVAYGAADWNNLTVWRNVTLNADSTLPGLDPPGLRNLRLQIDATLGNGDGTLSAGEITAFQNWLTAKGPGYVTTDGFFTTNSRSYNSTLSSFALSLSNTLGTPNAKVWINTTAQYKIKGAPPYIANGGKTYFVNLTMIPDKNVSVYQDYLYFVSFPKKYELNSTPSTISPAGAPVTISNYTTVTVDPGVWTGLPPAPATYQYRMVVSQSLQGVARAKVIAPAGKFNVVNATFTNYQAYVANNTTITFSAGDSFDPNGPASNNNFTWRFTPNATGWGLQPQYKYLQSGQYIVNLTMREGGGNLSFRNITIWADDQLPVARIHTNRTGAGSANGMKLKVDEGITVRFDGALSSDLAYLDNPNKDGKILDSGYAWDFNGDRVTDKTGRIVDWTFTKPGLFKVNLTVTDSVGWKGANATITAQVNDTKAPVPAFDILDPLKDWAVITSPIEQRTIALNASKSTDDYNTNATLNYTWTIPGPITGMSTQTNHTLWGSNVSFAWLEWNNSYKVTLSVRDSGFRDADPAKPNTGNFTRNVNVQIDPLLHADLRLEAGTLKVTPTDPAEGDLVTVTVNVTNKPGRASAGNVTTEVRTISGGVTAVVSSQAEWFDKNGNPKGADHTIPSDSTVKLVFTVRLYGQGNKTLQAYVFDKSEPYTWITPENKASIPINVRQPWWQPWAIAGAVIGVIVLFVFGMYFRRKVKAGEWRPLRGRRGEKGGEEERKPRREVKEEKKRL